MVSTYPGAVKEPGPAELPPKPLPCPIFRGHKGFQKNAPGCKIRVLSPYWKAMGKCGNEAGEQS
jgi:hypothetical protein